MDTLELPFPTPARCECWHYETAHDGGACQVQICDCRAYREQGRFEPAD